MRRHWIVSLVAAAVVFALVAAAAAPPVTSAEEAPKTGPTKTAVVRSGNTWVLVRDGKPFFIMGAGGGASKQKLAEAGANSFRTWGPPDTKELDEAQGLGLAVTVGIGIGTDGGFNYSNSAAVAKQLEDAKGVINRLKDHPAVLMWGIGNEMEGTGKPGDNPLLWRAIDDIAAAAKQIDPNHPTMTVIAELGGVKVRSIHQFCPHINVVGVNSYGAGSQTIGIAVPQRRRHETVRRHGIRPARRVGTDAHAPPLGVKTTAPAGYHPVQELTSTEKARFYRDGWRLGIAGNRGFCLGGYAFTWGAKWEATATWYGLFLADGAKVEAVDALTELWSGKPPPNFCPKIRELRLVGGNPVGTPRSFAPGATIGAHVTALDPENDPLTYKWSLNVRHRGPAQGFPRVHQTDRERGRGTGTAPGPRQLPPLRLRVRRQGRRRHRQHPAAGRRENVKGLYLMALRQQ